MNMWRKDAVSEGSVDASGSETDPVDRSGAGGRIDTAETRTLRADLNESGKPAPQTAAIPNARAPRNPFAGRSFAPAPARTQAQAPLPAPAQAKAGVPAQAPDSDLEEPLHDPHELTVQMSTVGLSVPEVSYLSGRPDERDGSPVFVDESGRRGRWLRRLGMAIGVACAVYSVVIVATLLSGSSSAPWLPVPAQDDDAPVSQVDPSSVPSQPAQPADPADATPTAEASQGTASETSSGTGAVTSPATSGPSEPTASSKLEPSARTTRDTTGSTVTTPPTASTHPTAASPSASAPATDASTPSPTTVDVLGLGPLADGSTAATPAS
ncbi:hypothetical protein ACFC00_24545 [Streptomyces adustus]|uniref:hypothetical protein n=1 Tax=Streptomyces adustus TaxID=1609272 RepID=UPI0035DE7CBC